MTRVGWAKSLAVASDRWARRSPDFAHRERQRERAFAHSTDADEVIE
jgi:hypothetical protein